MSVQEFLALPDDGIHRELINGRVWEERDGAGLGERGCSVTVRNRLHSRVEARITYFLMEWLLKQPEPRGEVVSGEAGFRLSDAEGSVVGIDVAVVAPELVAATGPRDKMFEGSPVLAVEILSPSDTHERVDNRVRSYLKAGTVVWVVDPEFETVAVHRPNGESQTLYQHQGLSGELYLPGFHVKVSALFA
jgi:Uma2 family endonuclease